MAQTVKHLSTMRETWVQSLGQEDPLENEMATHSSSLAWKIPWTEEPGRLPSMGLQMDIFGKIQDRCLPLQVSLVNLSISTFLLFIFNFLAFL